MFGLGEGSKEQNSTNAETRGSLPLEKNSHRRFKCLITGEAESKEEERLHDIALWKKAFAKISADVEIVLVSNLSSLVSQSENASTFGEDFDLVMIDVDLSLEDNVKRSTKAAKILRLLNYSAPIIGFISNPPKDWNKEIVKGK